MPPNTTHSDGLDDTVGRVYVRRRGRMTAGQTRALAQDTDRFRISAEQWQILAQQAATDGRAVGLEIGFGMGQAVVQWCAQEPDLQVVGVEVYQPGIGSAMLMAAQQEVHNLHIVDGDADALLQLTPAAPWLKEVRVFFPDPWPKKRHHKRRLLQAPFIATLAQRLVPGGLLRVATDWKPYADDINQVLGAAQMLINLGNAEGFAPRFAQRGTTNFEARGQRLGHGTWDFLYQKA
ncbi:MAG: tRNA (guanosine(46)-N7)-methyltransferase TrmB [Pseudomonadales bacterium]